MENWEQQTLINELTQGMELAKQLRNHVGPSSTTETREYLVQKILSSYDKALMILNWSDQSLSLNGQAKLMQVSVVPTLLPESPGSFDGSPNSETSDKGFKDQVQQQESANDVSKKRKSQPKWTDHVRIYSENGLEGPHDDGYSWRKYGQKDILGAVYPRSYYRCTYRNIKHCWATKQVQRSDEDPTVFEITYKGKHSCVPDCNPNVAQDGQVQINQNTNGKDVMQYQTDDILLNMKNNLRVNTKDSHNKEMVPNSDLHLTSGSAGCVMNGSYPAANLDGSLMQIFASSATSGSNYLPVSPIHQTSSFGGGFGTVCCSESERSDIFSSNASTTNSPYLELDFNTDHTYADPTFPFSTPGFFPASN